jgi:uridylate kinase
LNAPVDPVAAALGEREKVSAIIINGKDLKNFKALLDGKEFEGSIIR